MQDSGSFFASSMASRWTLPGSHIGKDGIRQEVKVKEKENSLQVNLSWHKESNDYSESFKLLTVASPA